MKEILFIGFNNQLEHQIKSLNKNYKIHQIHIINDYTLQSLKRFINVDKIIINDFSNFEACSLLNILFSFFKSDICIMANENMNYKIYETKKPYYIIGVNHKFFLKQLELFLK